MASKELHRFNITNIAFAVLMGGLLGESAVQLATDFHPDNMIAIAGFILPAPFAILALYKYGGGKNIAEQYSRKD